MHPDANMPGYALAWPYVSQPLNPTAEDHARHTTRPGIHYPSDVGMTSKASKLPFKAKKFSNPLTRKSVRTVKRRKKQ